MWKEVVLDRKRAREKRKKLRKGERETVKYLNMRFKMLNGERNQKSSRI